MSFSVFRIPPGKLFIRNYETCLSCNTLMARLNTHAHKVEHQDDLFCLLGSILSDEVDGECLDLVASIFVSRFNHLINDVQCLSDTLECLHINISYDKRGFWLPTGETSQRVVFIQRKLQQRSALAAG